MLAIYDSLHMPEEERIERHNFMAEYVSKYTIQNWAENFVTELQTQEQVLANGRMCTAVSSPPLPPLSAATIRGICKVTRPVVFL